MRNADIKSIYLYMFAEKKGAQVKVLFYLFFSYIYNIFSSSRSHRTIKSSHHYMINEILRRSSGYFEMQIEKFTLQDLLKYL